MSEIKEKTSIEDASYFSLDAPKGSQPFHGLAGELSNNTREENNRQSQVAYWVILGNIIRASIPSILGLVFQMLVEVVNLVFVGHLNDPVALGGVGLGNLLINVICFTIGMGLNGALDTLVSQAHGDRQSYLCG